MVSERNRNLELIKYINSLGIKINIGQNKARGNNGIFMHKGNDFRIDISKNLSEEQVLSVILHELAHYIHYTNDKKMKSLDFIFGDFNDDIKEELIEITVQKVPKEFALSLYEKKKILNNEIKHLACELKTVYSDFKLSEKYKPIEKTIPIPFKYLLSYDRIKFLTKIYSIDKLNEDSKLDKLQKDYIIIKSKQRKINRINSKINRLNRYYSNNSELFARFMESYFLNPELTKEKAPNAYKKIQTSDIKIIKDVENALIKK